MVSNVTGAGSLSQIMSEIELGPTGSIQLMFAKLQLAESKICKSQAEEYMKQIQDIQEEQKAVSEMISQARAKQQEAGKSNATYMTKEMSTFFSDRGLSAHTEGNDLLHNKDEWEYNLKSLTDYQQSIGSKTQTLMVYLQDFIGQYNSYLQGASSAISDAKDTLSAILR